MLNQARRALTGALVGLSTATLAVLLAVTPVRPAAADPGFQRWIADFESTAVREGVSREIYRQAFSGVTSPDPDVIRKARHQPEFKSEIWDYLDSRVTSEQVGEGRQWKARLDSTLARIEQKFGVDRHILLAIWSMESNYGAALQRQEILHHLPRAMATLAYLDQRRAKFARSQLIAGLKIAQKGNVTTDRLIGSWAGALGHTQFIPTSYQTWAVDFDGDGRSDIWNSVPDALASAANLLRQNGWQTGRTWGYEVIVPDQYRGRLERDNKTLAEWQSLGFRRPDGSGFAHPGDRANLVRPAGDNGPAFLMTKNFFVLKAYNNADSYALGVGLLADGIAGYGGLRRDWPRGYTPLTTEERHELQQRLAGRGLYDGVIDGKIGSGSKTAIMAFQSRAGLPQDGNASKALLEALRRN